VVTHHTTHEIAVKAPADTVFELIADVAGWPHVFGPTVHVDLLNDGPEQLLHIWATANGEVRDWTSRRTLDRAKHRISFNQVVSSAPVASMGGEWIVEPDGEGGCAVTLLHDYEAIGDDEEAVAWIGQAVDRNSTAELAALKTAAESVPGPVELRVTFNDEEIIEGPREQVFDFLNRADLWPQRLPHVSRLELAERVAGVQHMEMDTRSVDGSVHTTVSARLCFPDRGVILYKQLKVPPVMRSHTGRWELEAADGKVVARSWHTVTLDPEGVRAALGPDATIAEAKEKVRHALGTNSRTTLRQAKEFVESGGGSAG
jgi:ribosome-associated toxin RatA of RatAB toxin-antitoxin module